MMDVTFNLTSCNECRHSHYTGGFSTNSCKNVCDHPEALKLAKRHGVKNLTREHDWKPNWLINIGEKIPNWCPLHHGYKYQ